MLSTVFLGSGLTSLGNFIIGWIAEYLNAAMAYAIIGAVMLLLSILLVYFTREHQFHE